MGLHLTKVTPLLISVHEGKCSRAWPKVAVQDVITEAAQVAELFQMLL